MRLLLIFFAVLILESIALENGELEAKWKNFKLTHKKQYEDKMEDSQRMMIFKNNFLKIEEHNKRYEQGLTTYKMGINQFSDMTVEEFMARNGLGVKVNRNNTNSKGIPYVPPGNLQIPTDIDWRKKGAVTPVGDQRNCGSCWSFSAAGSLEGLLYIKINQLIPLSEQQLIDCTFELGNQGCSGGFMDTAFKYVMRHGITSDEVYPYLASDEECRITKEIVMIIYGYYNVAEDNEFALQSAVANNGPISVAVDASNWQHYAEGIFYDVNCNPQFLNHGVLLVGYGVQNESDYWLIKNSWGKTWGDEGYIKLARNKENHCGVASQASFPYL